MCVWGGCAVDPSLRIFRKKKKGAGCYKAAFLNKQNSNYLGKKSVTQSAADKT